MNVPTSLTGAVSGATASTLPVSQSLGESSDPYQPSGSSFISSSFSGPSSDYSQSGPVSAPKTTSQDQPRNLSEAIQGSSAAGGPGPSHREGEGGDSGPSALDVTGSTGSQTSSAGPSGVTTAGGASATVVSVIRTTGSVDKSAGDPQAHSSGSREPLVNQPGPVRVSEIPLPPDPIRDNSEDLSGPSRNVNLGALFHVGGEQAVQASPMNLSESANSGPAVEPSPLELSNHETGERSRPTSATRDLDGADPEEGGRRKAPGRGGPTTITVDRADIQPVSDLDQVIRLTR